ncbi:pseudouridine synthase [Choiromyces venosus 120613-1]|uniref:Pseudouridine synthase n=1 Tax=Choiromyces venosus 120613-1 TaxID=1336337 RepID=A0A3N4J968_9PEZI|nr:pseudouridine synthase [Choiromyces venosus 120613-1]
MHPKINLLITLREFVRISGRKYAMDTILSELSPMATSSEEKVLELGPSSASTSPPSERGERQPARRGKESVSMGALKEDVAKASSKIVNPPPVPQYTFEDGLRRVPPYQFSYNTYCKERWRGKSVLEVFLTEFRDRPVEYYKSAIEKGSIKILRRDKTAIRPGVKGRRNNGAAQLAPMQTLVASLDSKLENGDMLVHTLHRHEPPVAAKAIETVFEDDRLIVINKPAGVPVHPAGRYNFNTVIEVMKHDRDGHAPLPCNRLDRLTSGLMFMAKTPEAANDFMGQLQTRTIRKQYVARVKGEFPSEEITCDQPILSVAPKLGLNRVRASGKTAKTMFRRLKYNPGKNYSIVECHPFTGRTHQIRVHLQFLGHPITNDPIYCNRNVWGPALGKGGEGDDEDIIERLNRVGREEEIRYDEIIEDYEGRKAEKLSGKRCEVCDTPLFSDPGRHELGIYLHAKRYECEDGQWGYETELPEWATED